MSSVVHFNNMTDQQKLEWLHLYAKQNPSKYLSKFGTITARFPVGHPFAGQPCKWDYVSPEEALKTISPSFQSMSALKVDIVAKEEVKAELPMQGEKVKQVKTRKVKANV